MDKYSIDSHKLYWHLDRIKEWQEKRVIVPIYLEISPIAFCNHKCIFCGLDFARENKIILKTEITCKRLRELGRLGVRSILYSGAGEPLLHRDFPKLVQTAKSSGMDVSVSTNGSIESCELWKEILPYLTWIRFSVDAGTAKIYTKTHNVPNSFFDKTIHNIREAIKIKKDAHLNVTIGIQFLIIEENLSDIENAIRLFSKLRADYISLKPYSLHPQMICKKEIIYTRKIIKYVEKIVDRYKGKTKIDIIFRRDTMEKYMTKKKEFNHCRALPFWGYVSTNGDFYACGVFIGDKRFKVGNIYNEDMQTILSGRLRRNSIFYGERELNIENQCRMNCRMARVNEFLECLENKPDHINFI